MEEEIKVTKIASCPSLSGRGTEITYETGINGDNQYIRLVSCTSSAILSRIWIPLADIHQLLTGLPCVTSKALKPLYAGRSSNSPGFLCACIIHENLTESTTDPNSPPHKKPAKPKKDSTKEISS